jgi:hypothetical protein
MIRLAGPDDADTVRRLAVLDGGRPLRGHVLLAELDGEAVAAVSIEAGGVVAQHGQPGADAARMLMARRYQLLQRGRRAAAGAALLRREVPEPSR